VSGVSVIVHCAARAHIMKDTATDPLEDFRRINVDGTLNLARQAANSGVKRFIFISSIGVNGAETFTNSFTSYDRPSPKTPYAISKYEAEIRLMELANLKNMEIVILRPPLIYGPNAPGNFLRLMRLISSGIPLPFKGASYNKRSFIYIDNLISFIIECIVNPLAVNQVFLVSDGDDVSTASFIKKIGFALGKPVRLVYVPVNVLSFIAKVISRSDAINQIFSSLQIDIEKTKSLLGWVPPITLDEGLRKTALDWLKKNETKQNKVIPEIRRFFDLVLCLFASLILIIPFFVITLLVRLTSPGPALYWSDRVGKNNTIFRMPKFRSMRIETPAVATHLLKDPNSYLTPIGSFLRKSSLDELPQLWSILKGDMSFIGPRPALFNQDDLIALRTQYGIDQLVPGLTGWAQINGRDELPIPAKVALDKEYLDRRSLLFDITILWLTFVKVIKRDGVSH
jgi:lipopolysaccharide/colanic/teichoic acid biosynthesis glycosyltransferase/nucleoside-diphosphate-sugar epimerase